MPAHCWCDQQAARRCPSIAWRLFQNQSLVNLATPYSWLGWGAVLRWQDAGGSYHHSFPRIEIAKATFYFRTQPDSHLNGTRAMSGRSLSPASATLALSVLGACLTLFAVHAAAARDCRWFGTKPFCDGQCPKGWDYTGQRRSCTTGSQRYCCEPLGSTTTVDKVAPCHKQCAPLLTAVKPVVEAGRVYGNCRALCDHKGNITCPDGHQQSWRLPKCWTVPATVAGRAPRALVLQDPGTELQHGSAFAQCLRSHFGPAEYPQMPVLLAVFPAESCPGDKDKDGSEEREHFPAIRRVDPWNGVEYAYQDDQIDAPEKYAH